MKKVLIVALSLLCAQLSTNAQNGNASWSGQQRVELAMNNALMIYFESNGSSIGPTVTLPFTSVQDFENGVESGDVDLVVKSNKKFDVSVKTDDNQFVYTGSASQGTNMSIPSVLKMLVAANNTGGTIGNQFSTTSYFHLNQNDRTLLQDCNNGNHQTFSVKYKATPGFNHPAGTYTTQVIFTATQQ